MKQVILIAAAIFLFAFSNCHRPDSNTASGHDEPQKILISQIDTSAGKWLVSLSEATNHLQANNKIYDRFLQNGTMHVGMYQPKSEDRQHPHDQDEVYIVMQGTGTFQNGEEKQSFQAGDVIFVPANTEHRFIDFSEDFLTWVVFYGPEGGEK